MNTTILSKSVVSPFEIKRETFTQVTLKDYYQLPSEKKKKYLQTPEAKFLFNNLPTQIKNLLINGFFSGKTASQIPGWNLVLDYFKKNSKIIPALIKNPGTFEMLEMIYTGEGVANPIDKYFFNCLSGQALRNRLSSTVAETKKILLARIKKTGTRQIVLDVGAGTGIYCIKLNHNKTIRQNTSFVCNDIDQDAIDLGEWQTKELGFKNIEFVKKHMYHIDCISKVDITLVIGILCGFAPIMCVRILRNIKKYSKKNSVLIAARLTNEMLKHDFLCAYILEQITGWKLQYPQHGELKKVFEVAGYKWITSFTDNPTNFYEIGIGQM